MLDAYALRNVAGRTLILRALLPMIAPDAARTWIDMAGPGTWEGHPSGPFTLDAAAFRACIAAFEAQTNPIPLDYNHASIEASQAPAAGWCHKLEVRDGRLCAYVEFTAKAADAIRAGEYRYCSPVFMFDSPDRVTGKPVPCDIHSIALTNTPFMDGQRPIALTRRAAVAAPTRINAWSGIAVGHVGK